MVCQLLVRLRGSATARFSAAGSASLTSTLTTVLTTSLATALLFTGTASAATFYWDEDGATAGFGTAGTGAPSTWAAPTPGGTYGWSNDATGASAIGSITTTTADTLNFGTDTVGLAAGTVTVSGTVNAANILFGKASGDITLTGGTISIGGGNNAIYAYSSGGSVSTTHTIDSNIAKTGGILQFGRQNTANEHYIVNGILSGDFDLNPRMQNGSGLLELNGLNTFTGYTAITTGQVNVNTLADTGTASSLGTGSVNDTISMGGGGGQQPRLVYTGAAATSTNRSLVVNSTATAGVIAQDGAVDFSGSVSAQGGSRNLGLTGTADTGINTVSGVMSDGTGTLNVRVANFGAVGVTGEAAFWQFTGANTYTGTTIIEDNSTLQLGDGATGGSLSTSSSISIESGSSFVVNQSDTVTEGVDFSGNLTGAGDVTMAGSGTLELLFDNAGHSGDTIVNNGTLRLVNTADLRGMVSDDFFINNGSTLEIESSVGGNNRTTLLNDSIFTFDSNGGGNIDFVSGNHLAQTGTSGTARFVTTGGTQNTITSSGGFINPQGSANHVTFDVADGSDDVDLDVSVYISNGTWRKDGAGTLSITSNNDSQAGGAININAGTFEIGGNGRIRSTGEASGVFANAINNEGIFKHNTTLDQTVSGVIGGTGAVVKDNTGTLTLSGDNTFTGNVLVSNGTLTTGINTRKSFGANSAGRTVTVDGATSVLDIANTNSISGAGHTTENDITLVAQNGGIIRNSGGALNRIGDVTLDGGTLEANVDNVNWGSWYFGTRNGSDATVTVSGSTASTISGAGNIALGANTQFNVADATLDAATDLTVSAILATGSSAGHTGGFTKLGTGTMELTGVNTYTGDTAISAGTLEIGGSGKLGSGSYAGAISNDGTFKHSSDQTQTLSGNITGSGTLWKSTGSALTLSGNNSYSGPTTVDAVLKAGSTTALSSNSAFTVNSGGNLLLEGNNSTIGSLAGAGVVKGWNTGTAGSVTLTTGGDTTSTTFSGAIIDGPSGAGDLSLTKVGSGTMTLSGANTYTGVTTVSAGTLEIGGAGQLGNGNYAAAIANNATFNYNSSATQTLSGVISGSGVVEMNGSSTLTLSGANTYTGATTVSAGTLQLDGSLTSAVTVGAGGTLRGEGSTTGDLGFDAGGILSIDGSNGATALTTSGALTSSNGVSVLIGTGPADLTSTFTVANYGTWANSLVDFSLNAGGVQASSRGETFADTGSAITLTLGFENKTWVGGVNGNWDINSTANWSGGSDALYFDGDNITFSDAATTKAVVINGANVAPGSVTFNNTSGGGAYTLSSAASETLDGSGGISVINNGTVTISSGITGSGTFTQSGAGTTNLSGANTYSGGTTISAGKIIASGTSALGTGVTTIGGTGKLQLTGATIDSDIVYNGSGPPVTGDIQALSGTNTINGNLTLNASIDIRGSDITWTGGVTSTGNQGLSINGSRHIFTTTAIDLNDGRLDITSAGTNLANATQLNVGGNDWGETRINFGGYLLLGGTDFAPTDTNLTFGQNNAGNSSGAFDVNGFDQTVSSLETRSGALGVGGNHFITDTSGAGTLTVNQSVNKEFQGRFEGGVALTKTGAGTLTLNNLTGTANSYSGGTTVDGGTLKLTGSGGIGTGGLTVNNGGTFSIANDDFNSLGGAITVNEGGTLSTDSTGNNAHNIGAITLNGGTLTSSGNTFFQGNWIFNGDVTVVGSALSTISGLAVGSQNAGGTFNVADSVAGASTDLLVSADITLGSLTKTGAGTMELTGANTYTGGTTVNDGTLLVNGSTASGSAFTVLNGATLGGTGTIGGETTLELGGSLSAGDGGIGTLTFSDTGLNSLDISGIGASSTSLIFDLGAATGTVGSGDLIDVAGTLSIGDGLLDLDDFMFNNLGATSVPNDNLITWNLFEVGSFDSLNLGTNTTDSIFGSYSATLAINGNFLQLTMFVPEPSSTALLGLGGVALLLRRKRSAA